MSAPSTPGAPVNDQESPHQHVQPLATPGPFVDLGSLDAAVCEGDVCAVPASVKDASPQH